MECTLDFHWLIKVIFNISCFFHRTPLPEEVSGKCTELQLHSLATKILLPLPMVWLKKFYWNIEEALLSSGLQLERLNMEMVSKTTLYPICTG